MRRILLLALLAAGSALAQYEAASVLGTVTDPTAAVVAGVKVTMESVGTGVRQTTTTDAEGNYVFLSLRIGVYRVIAEVQGFKQMKSDPFTLTVNASQRVNACCHRGCVDRTSAIAMPRST